VGDPVDLGSGAAYEMLIRAGVFQVISAFHLSVPPLCDPSSGEEERDLNHGIVIA
jgi:hypothetical protein